MKTLNRLMFVLAVLVMTIASSARADTVHLKDGRVLEGKVVQEIDGAIWFQYKLGGLEKKELFVLSEVVKVERDGDAPKSDPKADPKTDPATDASNGAAPVKKTDPAAPSARRPGVTRAAVITLGDEKYGDMVGVYMTANSLAKARELLKKEDIDTVILRVHSGGGYLFEIQRLSDEIHNNFKKDFRVVGWIDSAISAAAMTALCIEDLYFTRQGHFGGCTGWSGQLTAVKGRGLEEVLFEMEKISARGKKDPKIMRAMQLTADESELSSLEINPPSGALSASIGADGQVTWYQNATGGENVLNPKGGVKILTFNSVEAEKFRFSLGTADTIEELARAMKLREVEWVGKNVEGISWPVSEAEQYMLDFRKRTKTDEDNARNYNDAYQRSIAAAQGTPDRKQRGAFIARARQALDKMKGSVKNNPNFKIHIFQMSDEQYEQWVSEQDELLRRLAK